MKSKEEVHLLKKSEPMIYKLDTHTVQYIKTYNTQHTKSLMQNYCKYA